MRIAVLLAFATTGARAQWAYTLMTGTPCSTTPVTPCQPGEYRACTSSNMMEDYSEGDCQPCQAGKYSPTGALWTECGAGYCEACPAGQYADETGATSCTQCAAGKIQKAALRAQLLEEASAS